MFDEHTEVEEITSPKLVISTIAHCWGYVYGEQDPYNDIHNKYKNRAIDKLCSIFNIRITDCEIAHFPEQDEGFTFTGSQRCLSEFKYYLENEDHPAHKIIDAIWLEYQEEAKQLDWLIELNETEGN